MFGVKFYRGCKTGCFSHYLRRRFIPVQFICLITTLPGFCLAPIPKLRISRYAAVTVRTPISSSTPIQVERMDVRRTRGCAGFPWPVRCAGSGNRSPSTRWSFGLLWSETDSPFYLTSRGSITDAVRCWRPARTSYYRGYDIPEDVRRLTGSDNAGLR